MRHTPWMILVSSLAAGCATMAGSASRDAAPAPSARPAPAEDSAPVVELQRQAAMAAAEIRLLRQSLAALQVEVERLATEVDRAAMPPELPGGVTPRFETTDLEPMTIPEAPAAPAPPLAPRETTPAADTVPPRTVGAAGASVPPAGQAIYDQGYTLYHQGRYVDAESSFQRFLQAYGTSELGDNAQYWIGESRFARQDYRGALAAFQEVLDRYPAGNKAGDALLKAGDCLARLGDAAGAALRYRQVADRFPGSAAAEMARDRLERPGG
jgi:tol-pal system protein YbgF